MAASIHFFYETLLRTSVSDCQYQHWRYDDSSIGLPIGGELERSLEFGLGRSQRFQPSFSSRNEVRAALDSLYRATD
jgi:hypothetical protein